MNITQQPRRRMRPFIAFYNTGLRLIINAPNKGEARAAAKHLSTQPMRDEMRIPQDLGELLNVVGPFASQHSVNQLVDPAICETYEKACHVARVLSRKKRRGQRTA